MRIASRCLPVGALPYDNIKHTTAMMAKLFKEAPFIPVLPRLSESDTIQSRSFENIPGLNYKDGKLILKTGTAQYENGVQEIDKAFNNPSPETVEPYAFHTEFLEKYTQIIKKFQSPNAYVNLLGPFTLSQILLSQAEEQVLADKSYRKLFIQAVCVKALWAIYKIKQACPKTVPIIILEEPIFNQLGMIKRENENITIEIVTNLFSKVFEKLKNAGAIVGVQCFEKCDWTIPIKAGADLISFDAYNNPNNLSIIPDVLNDFLKNGGLINWGIVPVVSENMVKSLTIDYLEKRLSSTIGGVLLSGVPAELLYSSALVSLNGNTNELPVMFSERAMMLASQLASRLSARI